MYSMLLYREIFVNAYSKFIYGFCICIVKCMFRTFVTILLYEFYTYQKLIYFSRTHTKYCYLRISQD